MGGQALPPRLLVDLGRVLESLGELGEEQPGFLDPRGERQVVEVLAEVTVPGEEPVEGLEEGRRLGELGEVGQGRAVDRQPVADRGFGGGQAGQRLELALDVVELGDGAADQAGRLARATRP